MKSTLPIRVSLLNELGQMQHERPAFELKIRVIHGIGPPGPSGWYALKRIVIGVKCQTNLLAIVAALLGSSIFWGNQLAVANRNEHFADNLDAIVRG